MKKEIRILGIDDGAFDFCSRDILVIGAVLRGNREIDGVLSCHIEKDGMDSTEKLIKMVKNSKYFCQLRAIMLQGSTLGGFNVVDLQEVSEKTKLPVISIFRRKPDEQKVWKALRYFPSGRKKFDIFKNGGRVYNFGKIYFQVAGATEGRAKQIIQKTLLKSNVPEPVRVAHLIASGISTGESTKRV